MKENVQHLDNSQLDQVVGGVTIPDALAPYMRKENDGTFFNVSMSRSSEGADGSSSTAASMKCPADALLTVMQAEKTLGFDRITFTGAGGNKTTMNLDDAISAFK